MTAPAVELRSRWRALWWAVPAAIVFVAGVIFGARWICTFPGVQSWLVTYPGHSALPSWDEPVGFPVWLQWQHFLNAFFMVLLIRSGLLIRRTKRPAAYWTRGFLRGKSQPKKVSINHWLHFAVDWVWILNGVVFAIAIFCTGQWVRIVPTSWDVFPNAISAILQYASLNWPHDNGWYDYNALQFLTYTVTVFIAAPLAFLTGIRMSPLWPQKTERLNKGYPIELARAVHLPTMVYFCAFIVVHVTLVFVTWPWPLRNLNHMFGNSDASDWWGFGIFCVALLVMAAGWIAVRPLVLRPLAQLTGKLSR